MRAILCMLTCGLLVGTTQLETVATANQLAVQTMLLTSASSQQGFGTSGTSNRQAAADYLSRARQALKQKNFTQAEQLIQQAERLNVQYNSLVSGFQDTPTKVRKDLQLARSAGAQLPSERYSILPFGQKREPATRPGGTFAAASQAGLLNTLTDDSKAKAASHLEKGRVALQQGRPEIALTWYQRAIAENAKFGPGEFTPQLLAESLTRSGIPLNRLAPVARPAIPNASPRDIRPTGTDQIANRLSNDNRRSGFAAGNAVFGTQQPDGTRLNGLGAIPTATNNAGTNKSSSDRYLHMARRSLAEGNITAARQLIAEARKQGVIYQLNDDSPQKIEDLVRRGEQFLSFPRNGSASAEMNKQYAQFLLAQADGLVRYREVELAKQMATHARNIPVQYAPQDRTPDKFLQQIAQSAAPANAPVRLPQADALPLRPRATTNQFNVAPAVAQQPIGNSNNNVVQSGYDPRLDQTRNAQVQATQPVVPRNANPLPAPNTQSRVNAGLDLYQQGLRLLEGQDRAGALTRFREAWNYEGQLDPVTRQQLRDKLTLLQTAGSAPLPSIPTEELSPIDELSASHALLRENLLREITAEQASAEKELKRDPRGANDRIQRLRSRVMESTLDPASRKQLLVLVDRTSTNINRYIEENLADIELQERNNEVRGDIDRDRRIKIDVQNKLAEFVDEFNELMDESRFEEAELIARKARALAPEEAVVKTLMWQSRFVRRFQEQMDIRDAKEDGFYQATTNVIKSSTPFDDNKPYQFDVSRWEELSRVRGNWMANQKNRLSDSELKIQRALSEKVDVQFENRPMSEVVTTLGQMVGVNVFLDPRGLHAEGYTADEPITLSLPQPISLKSVLNIILDSRNLSYVIQNEVLMITSEQTRDMDVYQHVYYVADLVVPIPNFVPSYNIGLPAAIREAHLAQAGQAMARNGRMPLTLAEGDSGAPNSVNPLALAQMQNGGSMDGSSTSSMGFGPGGMGGGAAAADFDTLIDLITSTIAPQSWDDVGGPGSIEGFPTNLSLVVAQTQEVHEQIADLLEQLRRLQDLQVTIEVRFITLNDNFFERIGIDFDFDIDDNSGLTNGNPTLPDDDGPSISVGLDATGSPTLDLDYSFLQDSFGSTVPQFGGFDAGTAANFGFAILSDIEVFFLLQASQGDTRSNVLQAPKVTLFNGQQAFVSDTAQRPFVTSVVPVVGDFAAAQQPVIVVLSEGTSLSVQAVVSADRRFVRLTLVPFFSTIGAVEEFTFDGTTTTNTGTTVADPANPTGTVANGASVTRSGTTVQLPTFAFTTVTTTVSVPDGGTVLLGGIKRLTEGRNERGVPMLSKLPYINRLFKNVGIGRTTQSLMLMVTPRIIIQEEEEEKLGISTEL